MREEERQERERELNLALWVLSKEKMKLTSGIEKLLI
jgi:hypothetical protein